ncbi:hypothetical protein A3F03_01005 [Candidatus Roizmanbacteria bacterium RIFCSPHIGHO2_12_FULL_41_11]|uniref:tRNA-guanine(15) transglycosylase-like domain-containing protein n=3 Tax=Candidatus Roizmaniibacteriota TaxID=1752723 RepID=A0A1F7JRV1_9BACT|nr:MAG: hypothetical protein A3F03_01005 [Candidatus Roizmanbacteria bacterium RIFCSPHIGHO2_12_FULL_41_11]OGK52237.1 MAG: hypothetical protein A2966_02445 [Candidatus Roizmanbacteria bacterium RIFCSPLOWO2_01_FULL_41_22]OGK58360.1 MAG: hypothetical protein A3H86_00210 [Candidatus Roizmanbacteria bacterium RIFCSPLOWO2_02_FULL_41_9]
MKKYFKSVSDKIKLPVFFPDATRGVIKTLDTKDIESAKTPGILVNTYHLYRELGEEAIQNHHGIKGFMRWKGAVISDSGGFQVMTLAKTNHGGKVTDEGATFWQEGGEILLTPEKSIEFQMILRSDMVVVLDDFTQPQATYEQARESVERTVLWAKRSKETFSKLCQKKKIPEIKRPYILGVVHGGDYLDLRQECTQRLVEIGFDGLGYGGWPIMADGQFNYDVAKIIAQNAPNNYFLYGLGVGKPHEIVNCVKLGYSIFDCVLPTRDARHKRLYIYNANSIDDIDLNQKKFYSYYTPDKMIYRKKDVPISHACDCLLCQNYSRAYLAHLFKIKELTAMRLSTIHNLRFYSILMEKLQTDSFKKT